MNSSRRIKRSYDETAQIGQYWTWCVKLIGDNRDAFLAFTHAFYCTLNGKTETCPICYSASMCD